MAGVTLAEQSGAAWRVDSFHLPCNPNPSKPITHFSDMEHVPLAVSQEAREP
jgi:hypothetical protein